MFKSHPFPLHGRQYAALVDDLKHLAYTNLRSLEAQALEMEPVRWRDVLSAAQNRLFSFVATVDDWIATGAEEDLYAAVQQVPLLSLALTYEEGDLVYVTVGAYNGRVVTISLPPLALKGQWLRLWEVLPQQLRDWLADDHVHVVFAGLWSPQDGAKDGILLNKVVSTEAMFALYQYLGIIHPIIKAERGTLDWQMSFAVQYHHLPSNRRKFKHLVGEDRYGKNWPAYREPGWLPNNREDPPDGERWFHYYQGAGPVLFLNRLLRHGLVYGGMKAVTPNSPLSQLFDVFLQGGEPGPRLQERDPLRLRHDWPSPRHYRGSPALQLYAPTEHSPPTVRPAEEVSSSEPAPQEGGPAQPPTPPHEVQPRGGAEPEAGQEGDGDEESEEPLVLLDEDLQQELEEGEVQQGTDDAKGELRPPRPTTSRTPPTSSPPPKRRPPTPSSDTNNNNDPSQEDLRSKLLLLASGLQYPRPPPPTNPRKGKSLPPGRRNSGRRKGQENRRRETAGEEGRAHPIKVWDCPPGPSTAPLAFPSAATPTEVSEPGGVKEEEKSPQDAHVTAPDSSAEARFCASGRLGPPPSHPGAYKSPDNRAIQQPLKADAADFAQGDGRAQVAICRRDFNLQHADRARKRGGPPPLGIRYSSMDWHKATEDQFPPIDRHHLDHVHFTAEEREQNAFALSPLFESRCTFCGASHCSRLVAGLGGRVMNCKKLREQSMFSPTRSICDYRRCKADHEHHTSVCPYLHGKCSICGCRGHRPADQCSVTSEAIMERLRADFEEVANIGVYTRERFSHLEWGFYPVPPTRPPWQVITYRRLTDLPVLDALAALQGLLLLPENMVLRANPAYMPGAPDQPDPAVQAAVRALEAPAHGPLQPNAAATAAGPHSTDSGQADSAAVVEKKEDKDKKKKD